MRRELRDQEIAATADRDEARPRRGIFIEQREIRRAPPDGLDDAQHATRHRQRVVVGTQRREQRGQQRLQAAQPRGVEPARQGAVAEVEQQPRELAPGAGIARGAAARREPPRQQVAQPLKVQRVVPEGGQGRGITSGAAGGGGIAGVPLRSALHAPGFGVALTRRAEHQGLEGPLHRDEVPRERVTQRRPIGLAHRAREPRLRGLVLRQRMHLRVAQHLQAVLEGAQMAVGGVELLHHLRTQQLLAA